MIKILLTPVLLFLVLLPGRTAAFRPFITDDAGTVTPATFELETAADYWHDKASFGLCFKHGITKRMDIGIAFGRCMLPKNESGYDLAKLLLKFNFFPDRLSASFCGSFGNPCYGAQLIYSQPISFFSIHGNLGYSAVGAEKEGFLTYGLAAVAETGRFAFGPELGGTNRSLDWWQFGLRISLTDWLAIDAAIGGNFERDVDFNAASGLFFAFPLPREEA